MADPIRVDPSLLRDVRRYGRFDATGCFNCGSCTLSCDLASDFAAFPRRSVQFVVVGLKEPLRASLAPWLCHDCGDCSTSCPRQAEPGESMATLRRYLIAQYDATGLAAKIATSRAWAAGSLGLAGLLVVLLVGWYHTSVVGMSLSDLASQSMGLAHMFPTITWFTLFVILFPLAVLFAGAVRMHRFTMGDRAAASVPWSVYRSEAMTFFRQLATQERMAHCPSAVRKERRTRHAMMAAGCFLMLVLLVFFLRFFQTDAVYPLYHPQRWLGYVATALLLYGTVDILAGRAARRKGIYERSEAGDYVFPALLFLTAATGIAVHVLRYAGQPFAAHYMYFAHLVIAVPMLVVEIPFGRWSHMVYRPLAIYFQAVREKGAALAAGAPREAA